MPHFFSKQQYLINSRSKVYPGSIADAFKQPVLFGDPIFFTI
jgi:hypothetical protein